MEAFVVARLVPESDGFIGFNADQEVSTIVYCESAVEARTIGAARMKTQPELVSVDVLEYPA